MIKLQSIDHSQLVYRAIHIKNILSKRPSLFGAALFFILLVNPVFAEVKVALIDTGFCINKVHSQSNIKVESFIDFTKTVKIDCTKYDYNNPRFHGQLVLEEFLKFYDNKKLQLHIYPLIVYNLQGDQKKEYWIEAINWIKNNKIDFVLTASGLITKERIVENLPGLWFVPSGRITPQIKDQTELFPQNLAPLGNLFLIGDFYDGTRLAIYDHGLLYKDKIDYYFPSGSNGFKGTSRAVAEAAARALNLCPISDMRACLKKLSKEYVDNLSHKKIQTY